MNDRIGHYLYLQPIRLICRFAAILIVLLSVIPIMFAPVEATDVVRDKKSEKLLAITINELPVAMAFEKVNRQELTNSILDALKTHDVKVVGFVVGANIEGSYDLLGRWLNEGHKLGNLTFSHQDLQELSVENFLNDVITGERALETMLSGFGQKGRYFRYPFLHYGSTVETKREMGSYVASKGTRVGHATVVIEDYLYNLSLENIKKDDSTSRTDLGWEYIDHVLDELERCERLAMTILKRPCRQILLLRANQLNAMVLDELLTAIEEKGYQFISLDRALEDEIYSAPEAYFGSRGIGYLDMLRESDPDLLPAY